MYYQFKVLASLLSVNLPPPSPLSPQPVFRGHTIAFLLAKHIAKHFDTFENNVWAKCHVQQWL